MPSVFIDGNELPNGTSHSRYVVDMSGKTGGYNEYTHVGLEADCMQEPCLTERLDEISNAINQELGEEE